MAHIIEHILNIFAEILSQYLTAFPLSMSLNLTSMSNSPNFHNISDGKPPLKIYWRLCLNLGSSDFMRMLVSLSTKGARLRSYREAVQDKLSVDITWPRRNPASKDSIHISL